MPYIYFKGRAGVGAYVPAQSLSRVLLFVTPWTAVYQAPLSKGFPRQAYWSGLPFPPPGDLPDSGIEPMSLALAGGFFPTTATWETLPMYSPYTDRTEAHFPLAAQRVKNPPAM